MKQMIVLSGPPGSGKGTQAELLCQRTGFAHFSTGDQFRYEITQKTEIGKKVQEYVKQGTLVPDEIVLQIANNFIRENKNNGIVFDGFPRTIGQAKGLDEILSKNQKAVDCAIFIELSLDEIIHRLTERRVCRNCGAIYNLSFKPPKKEGICDICNGELYQRSDDSEITIRRRYEVYQQATQELMAFYHQQNKLYLVRGEIGKDLVQEKIFNIIASGNPQSASGSNVNLY
uniref:Adenylate kinase n=1 Tax=candidate division WOR-3 bacterium TaxID=2052148 RepID=A0A7C6EDY8_UNCW3